MTTKIMIDVWSVDIRGTELTEVVPNYGEFDQQAIRRTSW
jgi:hypothetical protein